MKKKCARALLILGVLMCVGPGMLVPNDLDMIFLTGGMFLTSLGALATLLSSRKRS